MHIRTSLIVVSLLCASSAPAQVVFSYVTDTPLVIGSPGQTVSVKLFLREEVSGMASSILALESGLFGGGVNVSLTSVGLATPAVISGISSDPAFSGGLVSTAFSATTASVSESVPLSATQGVSGSSSSGITLIPLGTLQAVLGSSAGEISVFSIGPLPSLDGSITFNSGYLLDQASLSPEWAAASSSTVSLSVVPEPVGSSIAAGMCLLGALAFGAFRETSIKRGK